MLWLALLGCGNASVPAPTAGPESTEPEPALPSVVLVTLDTTRADRLGAYGYADGATPHLDALAAGGRVYEWAWSPLPLTIPAHSSLFTAKYPPALGVRSNGSGRLEADELTLAERMQEAGYATVASTAAFVTTAQWGFNQGFDAYYDDIVGVSSNVWRAERPGSEVVDDLLAWKAERAEQGDERPVFAWVHMYDAHAPYRPGPEHLARVDGRPYDGELAVLDDQMGRLVSAFEGEPVLFVVVGDHGESLGEHHERAHGNFTYASSQHVPYIVHGPGIEPERVSTPVSLVDVAPTLLDHLGLPPLDGVHGAAVPGEPRPVYAESWQLSMRFGLAPHLSVVDGSLQLIDTPVPELYDVVADPGQARNLAADRPADVQRLRTQLAAFGFDPPSDEAPALDPDEAAQLAALGYVDGGVAVDWSGPLPDPKDHTALFVGAERVDLAMLRRDPDAAMAELEELIEVYPDVVEFRLRLATLYGQKGRIDEAEAQIEYLVAHAADHSSVRSAHAGQLMRQKRFAEAALLFRTLAEESSYQAGLRASAVRATLAAGRLDEALELAARYQRDYPDDVGVAGVIGVYRAEQGDWSSAMALLQKGVETDRPEPSVAFLLATHHESTGELDAALRLARLELRLRPEHSDARRMVARILGQQGDWLGQVDVLPEPALARYAPDDEWLAHARCQGLFNLGRFAEARSCLDPALARFPADPHLVILDANLMMKEGIPRPRAEARFTEGREMLSLEQGRGPAADRPAPTPAPAP